MSRWVMVIDIHRCIGCKTCVKVCAGGNDTPPGANWRQIASHILATHAGDGEFFFTYGCMHCGRAGCLDICPTSATYRRPDGIVDIHSERCIGCAACIAACPYNARRLADIDSVTYGDFPGPVNPSPGFDRIGTVTKCNFCLNRIDAGISRGLTPGIDAAATPLCVRHCIGGALHFGDLEDPGSNVAKLLKERRSVNLQDDLNLSPGIYFLLDDPR